MFNCEFTFNLGKKRIDKVYKSCLAFCDDETNEIVVNLYNIKAENETALIKEIASTISHEYLHLAIWQARKTFPDKYIYDFHEEKIIRESLGEKFDPEDYYELIQGEDFE
jgi:hypothetical protein